MVKTKALVSWAVTTQLICGFVFAYERSWFSQNEAHILCSKTCGSGKKKRIVYCGNPSSPSDASRCPGQAPDEYGECNLGNCSGQEGSAAKCTGDKMAFCRHANPSLCSHPSHYFVCCESCERQSQSQLRPYYRQYSRQYIRRVYGRNYRRYRYHGQ